MLKENTPPLSDEFLDKVVKEINQMYGDPAKETIDSLTSNDELRDTHLGHFHP